MAFGKNYNPEGGIIDTPIGVIDVTPSAPNFGKTQTLVLLAETFKIVLLTLITKKVLLIRNLI